MNLETKYNVGDKVYTVNRYPIGARVFEGKVTRIHIDVAVTGEPRVSYGLDLNCKIPFSESSVYGSREEAEKVRQEWIDMVNKSDEE